MSPATEDLSLQEVADELGVHYMTAYRYVRLGMLPARREGRSWRIRPADLGAFATEERPRTPRGEADWDDRFFNRLIAGDEAGTWGVVEAALASGMSVAEAYLQLLIPALRRIGDAWRAGEIDIATEHAASQVASRIIGRLGPRLARRGIRRGTVVLGSTATELHSLPLAIVTDLFRAANFETVDLGVFLPPESFARVVADTDGLVAVGISVTTPDQEEQIEQTLAALTAVTTAPIILGGAGVDEATVDRLGVDGWGRSASDAIALVETLLAAQR